VLREGHLNTLASASYLVSMFQRQGKYKAVKEINLKTLKGKDKVFRKEHPYTLRVMSKLAGVL